MSIQNCEGKTLLHLAVKQGHFVVFKALLQISAIEINCQDYQGMTAFHLAASQVSRKKTRENTIFIAAEAGHLEIVRVLIDLQASIYSSNHEAIQKGHLEVVKAMIEGYGYLNYS